MSLFAYYRGYSTEPDTVPNRDRGSLTRGRGRGGSGRGAPVGGNRFTERFNADRSGITQSTRGRGVNRGRGERTDRMERSEHIERGDRDNGKFFFHISMSCHI